MKLGNVRLGIETRELENKGTGSVNKGFGKTETKKSTLEP